jgi:hypothetical protein
MSEWTSEWPAKVGWYWFYGHKYGEDREPEYGMVRVFQGANALIHTIDGQFMFRSEGHNGVFMAIEPPQAPELT